MLLSGLILKGYDCCVREYFFSRLKFVSKSREEWDTVTSGILFVQSALLAQPFLGCFYIRRLRDPKVLGEFLELRSFISIEIARVGNIHLAHEFLSAVLSEIPHLLLIHLNKVDLRMRSLHHDMTYLLLYRRFNLFLDRNLCNYHLRLAFNERLA